MAEFLGDLAFMFEIFVLGAGLVVLYFGLKESSKLLKASGYIMSVVATLGIICTGYYYLKYYFAGSFDQAYPQHHMMKQSMMQNMMKGGMMGKGMMSGQGMGMMKGMMQKNMQQCMGSMQGKMMNPEMMKKMKGCMMQGMGNMEPGQKEMSKEEHESHH